MQFLTTLLSSLALAASTTTVTAAHIAARDQASAVAPAITSINEGDVWVVGSYHNITWDTSSIPSTYRDNLGSLVLYHVDNSASQNPHFDHELASDFLLKNGIQTIVVPFELGTQGTDYFVILFGGDVGYKSPVFSILTD